MPHVNETAVVEVVPVELDCISRNETKRNETPQASQQSPFFVR